MTDLQFLEVERKMKVVFSQCACGFPLNTTIVLLQCYSNKLLMIMMCSYEIFCNT